MAMTKTIGMSKNIMGAYMFYIIADSVHDIDWVRILLEFKVD